MATNSDRPTTAPRRTDLDLVRIVLCVSVIVIHAWLPFTRLPFALLASGACWLPAELLVRLLHIFVMPGFFVVAGCVAAASLRRRSAAEFIDGRMRRLGTPALHGVLFLCPVVRYVSLLNGRDMQLSRLYECPPLQVSFIEYLPRYYSRLDQVNWAHVWFLIYLYLISVGSTPAVIALNRWAARRPERACPAWLVHLPGPVLGLWLAVTGGWWPYYPNLYRDGPNLVYYIVCYLLGAAMAAWPPFGDRVRSQWPCAGLLGMAASAVAVAHPATTEGRVAVAIAAWSLTGALLGLAGRRAWLAPRPRHYLAEASLALYLLHVPVASVLGWWVIHRPWPLPVQAAVLLAGTLVGTTALYEVAVRRWQLGRRLLGLRAGPRGIWPPCPPVDEGAAA